MINQKLVSWICGQLIVMNYYGRARRHYGEIITWWCEIVWNFVISYLGIVGEEEQWMQVIISMQVPHSVLKGAQRI
jgi:hypothetical protein